MRKKLVKKQFETIQIESEIKQQIAEYCERNHMKYGNFVKKLFQEFVSGSVKP